MNDEQQATSDERPKLLGELRSLEPPSREEAGEEATVHELKL